MAMQHPPPSGRADAPSDAPGGAPGLRCDFCGALVSRVRRVALDRDYDRLQTPHEVRYACPDCSQRKEQERLGLARR